MSSPLHILYEDEAIVIVEKPAGLPSLAAQPGRVDPNTVEGWLQKEIPSAKLVHRLDNDTSGLMMGAKTEEAFKILRNIWNTSKVIKKYTALVCGHTPPSGTITTPIAHHPRKKKKMSVGGEKTRPAHTQYKVLQYFKDYTLLEVQITTGVRHQIRVHLASMGHPVAGDKLYPNRKRQKEDPIKYPHHLLHLSYLSLPHPKTAEKMEWRSNLPKSFTNQLSFLKLKVI